MQTTIFNPLCSCKWLSGMIVVIYSFGGIIIHFSLFFGILSQKFRQSAKKRREIHKSVQMSNEYRHIFYFVTLFFVAIEIKINILVEIVYTFNRCATKSLWWMEKRVGVKALMWGKTWVFVESFDTKTISNGMYGHFASDAFYLYTFV